MVKIEKNVPFPAGSEIHGNEKYPWKQMEIGDSFFVERPFKTFCAQAYWAGTRLNKLFKTKKENNGTRVWRIK